MAAAGGVGLDVYLDDIPIREEGMTPQEILLSESQNVSCSSVKPTR